MEWRAGHNWNNTCQSSVVCSQSQKDNNGQHATNFSLFPARPVPTWRGLACPSRAGKDRGAARDGGQACAGQKTQASKNPLFLMSCRISETSVRMWAEFQRRKGSRSGWRNRLSHQHPVPMAVVLNPLFSSITIACVNKLDGL